MEYKPDVMVDGLRQEVAGQPGLAHHLWGIEGSADPHADAIRRRKDLAGRLVEPGTALTESDEVSTPPSGGHSAAFTCSVRRADAEDDDAVLIGSARELGSSSPLASFSVGTAALGIPSEYPSDATSDGVRPCPG